jgi:hypothetical protein
MSSQQPKQSWQHDERHYCAVCNAWMGSDRQSILIHENGKKHQENVERALQEKRVNKQKEGQSQKFLADSLKQMEAAAALAGGGGGTGGGVANNSYHHQQGGTRPQPPPIPSNNHAYHPLPHHHNHYHHHHHPTPPHPNAVGSSSWSGHVNAAPHQQQQFHLQQQQQPHNAYQQSAASTNYSHNNANNKQLQQQEKIDWQAQKLKREEINTKKRNKGGEESDSDEDQEATSSNKRPKITFRPDEGFYTYNSTYNNNNNNNNTNNDVIKNEDEDAKENDCDAAITQQQKTTTTSTTTTTYLEGPVFFGLLCEEMPVEIWSGPSSYSSIEKRLQKNAVFWKDSLVVAVVMTKNNKVKAAKDNANEDEDDDDDDDGIQRPVIHVSYLKTLNDTEETIEKNVSVDRIRIILGGDKLIPDTIEACRLLALGGEEIQVSTNNNNAQDDAEMMEATGLSGWSTVTIKKTSILQESRDEKEKLKEQRRQVRADREAEHRRTEARRMEEAKVSNADDSALGAYDVWGKGEYKGIDISKELDCPIEETAKRLAGASSTKGKISFKKRTKKKGAGMARRKTSADDDD